MSLIVRRIQPRSVVPFMSSVRGRVSGWTIVLSVAQGAHSEAGCSRACGIGSPAAVSTPSDSSPVPPEPAASTSARERPVSSLVAIGEADGGRPECVQDSDCIAAPWPIDDAPCCDAPYTMVQSKASVEARAALRRGPPVVLLLPDIPQDQESPARSAPGAIFAARCASLGLFTLMACSRENPNPHHVSMYRQFNPLQAVTYQIMMLLVLPI